MKFELTHRSNKGISEVSDQRITFNELPLDFEIEVHPTQTLLRLRQQTFVVYDVVLEEEFLHFRINGERYSVSVRDEQALLLEKMGFKSGNRKNQGVLKSPMPGKIMALRKSVGDTVTAGEAVVILEAMKMENELKAPSGGVIKAILVKEGQSVEKNIPLLEIE